MRVIAGIYRGRPLQAPKGNATRPTTDRVRESLFSTISSARGGFEDAIVLDAFAGSGALGIEALSRGAAFACFCEKDRNAQKALSLNVRMLDSTSFKTVFGDVFKRSVAYSVPYDLVFLDPPYAFSATDVAGFISTLWETGVLASGAIVSYEHDRSQDVVPLLDAACSFGLQHVTQKVFGDTAIDLFRVEG